MCEVDFHSRTRINSFGGGDRKQEKPKLGKNKQAGPAYNFAERSKQSRVVYQTVHITRRMLCRGTSSHSLGGLQVWRYGKGRAGNCVGGLSGILIEDECSCNCGPS
jgi:hypothetical protein